MLDRRKDWGDPMMKYLVGVIIVGIATISVNVSGYEWPGRNIVRVTGVVGEAREARRFHNGVDMAYPNCTPIYHVLCSDSYL